MCVCVYRPGGGLGSVTMFVVVSSFLQVEIAHISRKNIIHLHCKQLSLWVSLFALFLLITLTVNDVAPNYCGGKKSHSIKILYADVTLERR